MNLYSINLLNSARRVRKFAWIGGSLLMGLAILVLAGFLTLPASAATITVTSTTDVVADDGLCTIREAIQAANTDSASGATPGECPAGSGPDVVSVPSGWYYLTPGAPMNPSTEMEIIGAGQWMTIIDGLGATQIFSRNPGSTALVEIRNMTLMGGISSGGGAFSQFPGNTIIENVEFYNNSAIMSGGGAIYNRSGDLTLIDCIVHYNDTVVPVSGTSAGGGIRNAGNLTVIRTIFNWNETDPDHEGRGGAITSAGTGSQLTVEDSTFTGNSAAVGGAIYSQGPITISGSTFSYNTSSVFPGVLRTYDLVMTNSTVSQNTNGGLATGGVASWVLNSTFYNNDSGAANIMKTSGTVTVKNSILLSFSGGTNCSGVITSGGYNLDNNSTCSFSATGDQSGVDPMLGQLVDNGGSTQTHALKPGSPVIDVGNPAGCTDDVGAPILTDQRGWSREIDGNADGTAICDIGAYESTINLSLPLIMR